jgi:hypothetical protein
MNESLTNRGAEQITKSVLLITTSAVEESRANHRRECIFKVERKR